MILKAFAGTFFDALLEAFKDWRAAVAQRDLGRAEQKQADTEAAHAAEAEASQASLRPADVKKTIGDIRNGDF